MKHVKDNFAAIAASSVDKFKTRYTHLKNIFQDAARGLSDRAGRIASYFGDIREAIRNPKVMSEEQRHLDEFKIVTGSALLGAGAVELNPLTSAGGAIPAWEGLQDLEKAGHKWRKNHPAAKP